MRRIIVIILLVGALAYGGMCVYANMAPRGKVDGNMPSTREAPYSLVIKNTATVILAKEYEVFGDTVGSRVYYLHGYWELAGTEFEHREATLVLNEQVFGQIDLKRR